MKSQFKYGLSFLVAFTSGTIVIIVSSIAFDELKYWEMIPPVAIMIIYSLIIWNHGKLSEEAVDSVYFLGFSFTLVALMVAMSVSFLTEQSIELKIVVRSFGIALTTTIVGIVSRIILLSLIDVRTAREIAETAHEDAISGLVQLREEVKLTVQSLSNWRTNADTHWENIRTSETNIFKDALEFQQNILEKQVISSDELIRNTFTELEKYTNQSIKEIIALGTESREQIKNATTSEIDNFVMNSSKATSAFTSLFSEASNEIKKEIISINKSYKVSSNSLISSLNTMADATNKGHDSFQAAISKLVDEIDNASISIGNEVSKQVEFISQSFIDASTNLTDSAKNMNERLNSIDYDQFNRTIAQSQKIFIDSFKKLSEKLSNSGDQLIGSFPSKDEYRLIFNNHKSNIDDAVNLNYASLKKLKIASNEICSVLKGIADELQNSSKEIGFKDLKANINNSSKIIIEHSNSLTSYGQEIGDVTDRFKNLAETANNLSNIMDDLLQGFQTDRKEIEEVRINLNRARKEITKDLFASQRALVNVMKTISNGVLELRKEIKTFED